MTRHALIILLLFTTLTACTPPPRQRVLWPIYPATPRIEWLGTYASQEDFPKTGGQIFSELIIGRTEPQLFKSPYGIARDSQGLIYVADSLDANLRIYDLTARTIEYFSKDVLFTRPAGIAIDAADNLYVVDSDARAVLVFNNKRQPLRILGGPEEFVAPAYIAIDAPRAKIYVSDPRANKILIYDRFGKKSGEIGGGSGYIFSSPQGMAIDKAGNLFVAELLAARISVFDTQGNFQRSFGERGDKAFQFEAPRDLAFDSDGNLWVADIRRAQIYTYTPEGVLLLATGTSVPSNDPLGFSMPTAITITTDDTILVTDRVNRRFSVWRYFSERYLQEHPFTPAEQAYLQEIGGKIIVPPAAPEVLNPQDAPNR